MIRISRTSKLDNIKSWSLEALDTCPGSKKNNGELVDACKGCYAVGGNYRFPNVKAPRIENKQDWKRPSWVSDMVRELDNDRYFRWFDSGDVYSVRLAVKIYEVMKLTNHVKHWIPTRMHKFAKFKTILARMQSLPNVMVRPSSDSVMGEFEVGLHGSTITPDPDVVIEGAHVCKAYKNEAKCGPCRACWDKAIKVIAYPAHGKVMNKVINIVKG
jgi:hypothetical protein